MFLYRSIRHIRPHHRLPGWQKKWAEGFLSAPAYKVLYATARLSSSWPSLRSIHFELEAALWGLGLNGRPLARGVVSEGVTPIELEKQGLLDGIEWFVALSTSPQTLALAHYIRRVRPEIRLAIFLTADTSALLRSLVRPDPLPLRTDDLLISLCRRDLSLIGAIYPKSRVATLSWLGGKTIRPERSGEVQQIVYAGRLNQNKNVHTLIRAYAELQNTQTLPPLVVMGGLDPYDNVLTEKRDPYYLEKCKALALELQVQVEWRDALRGPEFSAFMNNKRSLFVALSTARDENHGIAAREWLQAGHRLVLSNWGGHADLLADWPSRVHGVTVESDDSITPSLCAQALARALATPPDNQQRHFQGELVEEVLSREFTTEPTSEALQLSSWAQEIHQAMDQRAQEQLATTGLMRECSDHALEVGHRALINQSYRGVEA